MNEIDIKVLKFAIKAHGEQKRKYTGEPYILHPIEVYEILNNRFLPPKILRAALLHDVVEDTKVTIDEITNEFGREIADLVIEVTDVYTPEKYPHLNRAARKKLEIERISKISNAGKIIKLADIISNTTSIVEYDKSFAKTYLAEKEEMLKVLRFVHDGLYAEAMKILVQSKRNLNL